MGNYQTNESFTGPKDYFPAYLASIHAIPKLSAAEETDLIARWRKFQDQKARQRVIEANLNLVPPIAKRQAVKFRLDQPTIATNRAAKNKGRPVQGNACFRDLVSEGSLALVIAFDSYPEGSNVRFRYYARTCIRNAIMRHAVSLLSAVERPWGTRVKDDITIDPTQSDMVSPEDYCGSRARPTTDICDPEEEGAKPLATPHVRLRPWPKEPDCISIDDLPPILELRLKGFKLKDIAKELGCSIPTAHRRVKAAIQEVRHA